MESQVGPETKVTAEVVGGQIKLSVAYTGAQVTGGAFVSSSSDQLLDAIAALIPGDSAVEQGAIGILKMFMKTLVV